MLLILCMISSYTHFTKLSLSLLFHPNRALLKSEIHTHSFWAIYHGIHVIVTYAQWNLSCLYSCECEAFPWFWLSEICSPEAFSWGITPNDSPWSKPKDEWSNWAYSCPCNCFSPSARNGEWLYLCARDNEKVVARPVNIKTNSSRHFNSQPQTGKSKRGDASPCNVEDLENHDTHTKTLIIRQMRAEKRGIRTISVVLEYEERIESSRHASDEHHQPSSLAVHD